MIRTVPKLKDAPGKYEVYSRRRLVGYLYCSESCEYVTLVSTPTYFCKDTRQGLGWSLQWLDGTYKQRLCGRQEALRFLLSTWKEHMAKVP